MTAEETRAEIRQERAEAQKRSQCEDNGRHSAREAHRSYQSKKWPITIEQAVIERQVQIRMTAEQVSMAWGNRSANKRSVGSWGTHEQWVYGNTYLYFQNGVLTSYKNADEGPFTIDERSSFIQVVNVLFHDEANRECIPSPDYATRPQVFFECLVKYAEASGKFNPAFLRSEMMNRLGVDKKPSTFCCLAWIPDTVSISETSLMTYAIKYFSLSAATERTIRQ
jgi:hypothetical protein